MNLISGGIPTRPLVAVRSLADTQRMKDDAIAKPSLPTVESDSALGGHIRLAWDRNKMAREKITQRLLQCLRARRGVYSQDELQQIADRGGLNVVYVELTEEKCKAAAAWIREVVMPVGDYPFALQSSPVPELPREMQNAIVMKAAQEAQETLVKVGQAFMSAQQPAPSQGPPGQPQGPSQQGPSQGPPPAPGAPQGPMQGQMQGQMQPQGQGPQPPMEQAEFRKLAVEIGERMRDEIEHEYKTKAQKAADKMQSKIQDYMAEGGWETAIDAFIEDFVTYPTAVMMGPVYQRSNQLKWGANMTPIVDHEPQMRWSWVPIFDCYPAQYATDCQTGDFIVRVRYTRRTLAECRGLEDYRTDQIDKALLAYTNGHLEGWIWQEAERQRLEQESLYSWLSPRGIIDAIHYWGSVPGWRLMSWGVRGMSDLDPVEEYEVDAILIGPYVIRCAINRDPLKRRPFFSASFDASPNSFWGRSVPDLGETCQKMVNASACAMADNLGWSSGPMAWVHVDRLADGENAVELIPGKLWQLKSDPSQGVNPGIGVFQIPSNADQLMGLIEKWSIKADDSTGVPRYTYGNERVGGAADTYSGLSMLMNNAAKGLRRAIGQIDVRMIEPTVYAAFINEMVFGKDQSLKADCVVVPKGATAMLVKEARNQATLSAAQLTANPIDMQIIGAQGRAAILRKVFTEAFEMDPEGIVPSDQQLEAQQQQAAQAQAAQVQAMQQAEQAKVDAQTQNNRETIASNERIEGARLAQKQLDSADRNRPKEIGFQLDHEGNVVSAKEQPPPPSRPAGIAA